MARRWRLPEHLNPFQQLLADYMRAHWPMTMTQLAEALELPPTTVYGWFMANRIPHAPALKQVATQTDIPLAALYRAAGYDVPAPPEPAPAVASRMWDSFYAWARDYDDLSPRARHDIIEFLQGWKRGEYEQFAAERAAEQHVEEAQPSPLPDSQSHATSRRDQATDTQHGAADRTPEQATRTVRRRRKDIAHTAHRP